MKNRTNWKLEKNWKIAREGKNRSIEARCDARAKIKCVNSWSTKMQKFREIAVITSSGIRNVNKNQNVYRNKLLSNHETYQTTFRQESVKSNKLRCLLLGSWPILIFKARMDTSKGKSFAQAHKITWFVTQPRKAGKLSMSSKTLYFLFHHHWNNSRKWKLRKMKTSRKSSIFHK